MSDLKTSFYIITVLLCFSLASLPAENFAQNNLRVYEDIGGNGNATQGTESNDNTFIYVAGGLLIAGIIAYALFIKKDTKKEVTDSTANLNSNLIYAENENSESLNESITKVKENIPVDFFFGIRNNDAMLSDRTYLFGVSFKL